MCAARPLGLRDPQAMNLVISALERRGLVRRRPDPRHQRVLRASVTRKGIDVLVACDHSIDAIEAEMLGVSTSKQIEIVRKALYSCARSLEAAPPPRIAARRSAGIEADRSSGHFLAAPGSSPARRAVDPLLEVVPGNVPLDTRNPGEGRAARDTGLGKLWDVMTEKFETRLPPGGFDRPKLGRKKAPQPRDHDSDSSLDCRGGARFAA